MALALPARKNAFPLGSFSFFDLRRRTGVYHPLGYNKNTLLFLVRSPFPLDEVERIAI